MMNMPLNITHKPDFTLLQIRQLLIAYVQVHDIKTHFMPCAAKHLHTMQFYGDSSELLEKLKAEKDTLVEQVKSQNILGGWNEKPSGRTPSHDTKQQRLATAARLERIERINRFLTDEEVQRFEMFFKTSGATRRDFAALFGRSQPWFTYILKKTSSLEKGTAMRLICMLDSEIELFEKTGSCRSLRGEKSPVARHFDENELTAYRWYCKKYSAREMSLLLGFNPGYMNESMARNAKFHAQTLERIAQIIAEAGYVA